MGQKTYGESWSVCRAVGSSGTGYATWYEIANGFQIAVGPSAASSGGWTEEYLGTVPNVFNAYFIPYAGSVSETRKLTYSNTTDPPDPPTTDLYASVSPYGGLPGLGYFWVWSMPEMSIWFNPTYHDMTFTVTYYTYPGGVYKSESRVASNHSADKVFLTTTALYDNTKAITVSLAGTPFTKAVGVMIAVAPAAKQYSYLTSGAVGFTFSYSDKSKNVWLWQNTASEYDDWNVSRAVLVLPNPAAVSGVSDLKGPYVSISQMLSGRNRLHNEVVFPDERGYLVSYFFTGLTIGQMTPQELFEAEPFYTSDLIDPPGDWRWFNIELDMSDGGFGSPPYDPYMYVMVQYSQDTTVASQKASSPNDSIGSLWTKGFPAVKYGPPVAPALFDYNEDAYGPGMTVMDATGYGYVMGWPQSGAAVSAPGAIDETGAFNTDAKYYLSPEPV